MNRRLVALMAWAALALGAAESRAHFLFIKIRPMAEGGRAAEVYFSDRAEAGDPKFVARIAGTQLWAQTVPGEFRPLTVHPEPARLRALIPSSGSVAVVGSCQYGVIARANQTPFLLRYYPKAIAGRPEALNGLKARDGLPLEIVATIEGDRLRLVALRDGKPVPKAAFIAIDDDLTETRFAADDDGAASWSPKEPGRYCVYTRHDTRTSGEADGARYEEIRAFATLAFEWPLVRTGADAEAVSLFKQALAARAVWKDFPGFTAQVAGDFDGHPFRGKVAIDANGQVSSNGIDPAAKSWVEGQLSSIVMHRQADSQGDDEPVLRFADDRDDHPLGRLLTFEGGRFASSYRVKDRRITSVNRHVGRSNMTITTLDNERNRDGLDLPRSYIVQYWDADSGDLRRVETIQDRWTRVGSFDLPAGHTVTTASGAGFSVRSLVLSGHELARPKP